MAVDQLPGRLREFVAYLDGLLARLDQGGGWCAVFWQRDPDGMQACLDGREVPPWDVVEALLQDLAAEYGPEVAHVEAERARPLHAAAQTAHDARPGGRDALGDRFDVMLREQRYAAERQAELGRLLAGATTQEEADAIRLDLAWARDDHERAVRRCAELQSRMAELDGRSMGGRGAESLNMPQQRDSTSITGAEATHGGPAKQWPDLAEAARAGHAPQESAPAGVAGPGRAPQWSGAVEEARPGHAVQGSASAGAEGAGRAPGWSGAAEAPRAGHAPRASAHAGEDDEGHAPQWSTPAGADSPGGTPQWSDSADAAHGGRIPQWSDSADAAHGGRIPQWSGSVDEAHGGRIPQWSGSVDEAHGGRIPQWSGSVDEAREGRIPQWSGSVDEAHEGRIPQWSGSVDEAREGRTPPWSDSAETPGAGHTPQWSDFVEATRPAYSPHPAAPVDATRPGPQQSSEADASRTTYAPYQQASPAVTRPDAEAPRQPTPGAQPAKRKRRRGSARFAGMAEEVGAPVVVPPAAVPDLPTGPVTQGRTPRGARFAGAAEAAEERSERRAEPSDVVARRETADIIATLMRLRAEGRTGEAHALLAEVAHWPADRFPLLAAELQRAGLRADWATLLWEAASLPADRLVAAADALVAAGRGADGEQVLRQGVARPAGEIGAAVLGLVAEGRRREVSALLDAYVRVRTPEEAARSAEPGPQTLVPLLLAAARGVSDERHWDLVHALRVAGFSA
ncbi:hypothetical protein [Streptomyces canus]|uniref:hypothetical protein n=1 Tax=Streptomyces canus TaxID=58343 RepID=UPI00386EDA74|nr:hypothetical protein OH824_37285 [Streptomyces canus]